MSRKYENRAEFLSLFSIGGDKGQITELEGKFTGQSTMDSENGVSLIHHFIVGDSVAERLNKLPAPEGITRRKVEVGDTIGLWGYKALDRGLSSVPNDTDVLIIFKGMGKGQGKRRFKDTEVNVERGTLRIQRPDLLRKVVQPGDNTPF